ncbi:MAG: GIY-YIG nuclease family protein [Calditrichaeota bacterium]|nr:GIY-YIG nuclease family protein [Calditrichota bacterium]
MFYVYLIESVETGTYYIGQTNNIDERVNNYHNAGRCKYTKNRRPWKLIAYKTYTTRSEAMREERRIKNLKSRKETLKSFGLTEA